MQKKFKAKKPLGLKKFSEENFSPERKFARAKKALGQNFLKSKIILEKIVSAGEISPQDIILEIGPGKGALTEKLLAEAGKVIAVEKDRALCNFLREKFQKEISERKLILVEGDVLEIKTPSPSGPSPFAGGEKSEAEQAFMNGLAETRLGGSKENRGPEQMPVLRSYKIIANIPYNITGAILKKFLTARNQPSRMVLMLQKEVAERITTSNPFSTRKGGKESLLSISVKAYGKPKIIARVPARYFSPKPKVDSAILLIENISRKKFTYPPNSFPGKGEEKGKALPLGEGLGGANNFEEKFWQIVHAGFAHKRKKLSSNLKNLTKISKPTLVSKSLFDIDMGLGNKRAEDLSLEDWLDLAKKL